MSAITNRSCRDYWKKEFALRLEFFSRAIGMSQDGVLKALGSFGVDGQEESSLYALDYEEYLPTSDLFAVFCDTGLVPKFKLRMGLKILRGKSILPYEVSPECSSYDDRKLLTEYIKSLGEVKIGNSLRQRTHGRPCLVLSENEKTIDIEASLILIAKAADGPTTDWMDANSLRVYRPGEIALFEADAALFEPTGKAKDILDKGDVVPIDGGDALKYTPKPIQRCGNAPDCVIVNDMHVFDSAPYKERRAAKRRTVPTRIRRKKETDELL